MPKDSEVLVDPSGLIMNYEVEFVDSIHALISLVVSDGTTIVPLVLDVNVDTKSCLLNTADGTVVDHTVGINSNSAIVPAISELVLTLLHSGASSFDLFQPSHEDPIENNVGSVDKSVIDTS